MQADAPVDMYTFERMCTEFIGVDHTRMFSDVIMRKMRAAFIARIRSLGRDIGVTLTHDEVCDFLRGEQFRDVLYATRDDIDERQSLLQRRKYAVEMQDSLLRSLFETSRRRT